MLEISIHVEPIDILMIGDDVELMYKNCLTSELFSQQPYVLLIPDMLYSLIIGHNKEIGVRYMLVM